MTITSFPKTFDKYACIGDTIRHEADGFVFEATIHDESVIGAPWENNDGHGPVSDWTSRGKRAGERVLNSDRHGSCLYYDFKAALDLAHSEEWGTRPGQQPGETEKQYRVRAVEADFKALKAWCNDEWSYCGIVVVATKNGITLGEASLWGVELNFPGSDNAYLTETANELLGEALDDAKATLAKLVA